MKLGLTLEGGASRTYFSNGVMDALLKENIRADYVIGASAGIANATSYVSGQFGRNLKVGEEYMHDKRYMGFRHMLRPTNRSYYNLKFVFEEIPNKYVPFDYEALNNAECETIAAVTNIETGETEYLEVTADDKKWKEVIASCSLPIMFEPVKIGDKIYMDGGITNPIPVNRAIADGCDKNIVVITRERDYVKVKESGVKLATRSFKKYPKFVEALKNRVNSYNASHKRLVELEKEGKVFVFSPENTEGWGRTDSDPEKLKMMYDAGYKMVYDRLDELKKYLAQ